jgi:hypothetical protein
VLLYLGNPRPRKILYLGIYFGRSNVTILNQSGDVKKNFFATRNESSHALVETPAEIKERIIYRDITLTCKENKNQQF